MTSCVRVGGVALVVAIVPHERQWSRCLHYSDVIMSAMRLKSPASRLFAQRFFRRRSKKTSKFRVTGLCEGNSAVTGGFPSQRASNEENVSL